MTQVDAIKLWKKNNIGSCVMNFSCGGDSMGETDFQFFDEKGQIDCDELIYFFNDEVYKHIDFYEVSDGHYIGESGTVEITLNDDDDNPSFEYSKSAQSEWSETWVSTMEVELTPAMTAYITENVSNINGSNNEIAINYKRDFILTPEQVELEEQLEALLEKETREYEPDDISSETDDWFTFSTNLEGEDDEDEDEDEPASNGNPVIKGNRLQVRIRNQYTDYRDSD